VSYIPSIPLCRRLPLQFLPEDRGLLDTRKLRGIRSRLRKTGVAQRGASLVLGSLDSRRTIVGFFSDYKRLVPFASTYNRNVRCSTTIEAALADHPSASPRAHRSCIVLGVDHNNRAGGLPWPASPKVKAAAKHRSHGLEWRAIQDIIKQRRDDSVIFLRFDTTNIPGLFSIDGYIDLRDRDPEYVAYIIIKRLRANVRNRAAAAAAPKR
jgi:hypothetical protein